MVLVKWYKKWEIIRTVNLLKMWEIVVTALIIYKNQNLKHNTI